MRSNLYILLILTCGLLLAGKGFAQPYPHHVTVWLDGGYGNLLENAAHLRSPGSFGFGAGVGYEWQHKKLLLHTGVEFRRFASQWRVDDFVYEQPRTDTEGDAYTARFRFADVRERIGLGYVQVPLMAGMQHERFYFLAGAKVGLNLMGRGRVDDAVTSSGRYDSFIDDFEDMPNHGFDTRTERHDYELEAGLNVSLAAEVGWHYRIGEDPHSPFAWRLALYGEYGLLNVQHGAYQEDLVLQPDAAWPVLNSLMRTAAGVAVHPLEVGVKVTFLFGIEGRRPCLCEYY